MAKRCARQLIVGIDGCPGGWIAITQGLRGGGIDSLLLPDVSGIIDLAKRAAVVAIDMPIGLPESGPRECDQLARRALSPYRAASVFSAPLRPMLEATSRAEAGAIRRKIEGKSISAQAWNISGRIRDLDRVITPDLQRVIHEVHPEVSFAHWAGGPMKHAKKTAAGRSQRVALIDATFGRPARRAGREMYRVRDVADDDLHDAFAALWTARRIAAGTAKRLPDRPPLDATGLRMEIVC